MVRSSNSRLFIYSKIDDESISELKHDSHTTSEMYMSLVPLLHQEALALAVLDERI